MNTEERRTSGFGLPLKATLSPAAAISSPASCPQSPSPTMSIPGLASVIYDDSTPRSSSEDHMEGNGKNEHHHHNAFARVTAILQKKKDSSPPSSPRSSCFLSPRSSSDSLASLVERQHMNKINNPSHQLFDSHLAKPKRKSSSHSIFNLLAPPLLRSNGSIPAAKSPLHNQIQPTASRRLSPSNSNPTHIHSSPSVKESKKVYLEYDPVSKKKMLNTYEIVKEIGRGEHGKVKLAKETNSGELVAIKILDRKGKPKLGKVLKPGSTEEEKIRKEIAIMKKINHPNVVRLKEVLDDTSSRKIYLVLEFLEKGEVNWQKAPGVPFLTLPEAMKVFRDVVLGLEYLHYQGIIHRDIKPANLLISKDGAVKISDFGVSFASSLKNGEEQDDYELAKTAGTPAFFAPEICQPLTNFNLDHTGGPELQHPKITSKIDIWALGVTLYCLLFGSMPFWATNEFELFKVICDTPLVFPSTYPDNYEWLEEDKFGATFLLNKMLDKDSRKRITISEIKRHSFVLRNLSVEESRTFITQKACENKIQVSNDEVSVAVTGIASKLRKGFAKAFKFATGIKSELNSGKSTPSSTSSLAPRTILSTKERKHSRAASSDARHLVIMNDDLSQSSSTLTDRNTTAYSSMESNRVSSLPSTTSSRSRMKSVETPTETRATVEGDLFLKRGSAFNSLSHIMNDDKRRLSFGSFNNGSTISDGYTTSNDSSFTKIGSQLVSLPVNASFASLDSVYMDSYATAYYTEVRDARTPAGPMAGKLQTSDISATSSLSDDRGQQLVTEKSKNETDHLFQKMSSFSLNKTTEQKNVDSVAPHEPVQAKFDFQDEDDFDSDDLGSSSVETYDSDRHSIGLSGQISSTDQASEFSVPSYLVNDLAPSVTINSRNSGIHSSESKIKAPKPSTTVNRTPIDRPKYSFFDNSDSEEESDEDLSEHDYSDQENQECFEIYHSDGEEQGDSSSGGSDTEELTLSFGRRGRTNTISTSTIPRPSSEPLVNDLPQDHANALSRFDKPLAMRSKTLSTGRVNSPLSKNAPHTPFSTINAHLLPKAIIQPDEYVNHYHKIDPHVPYHLNHDLNNAVDGDSGDSVKHRSNSITMGILGSNNPHGVS